MVGTSKILTVSYGTFSCTLEGFDDPFSAMRQIAEYFRDLAAEDRFFGAEPPTPDAETLARLAQAGSKRRVTARLGDQGISLHEGEAELVAPPAETAPEGPAVAGTVPVSAAPVKVPQAPAAPAISRATVQAAPIDAPAGVAQAPHSVGAGHAADAAAPSDAHQNPQSAEPKAQIAPQGDKAETIPAPSFDSDFAAKMLRIRAAAARTTASDAEFEDQFGTGFVPISAAFSDAKSEHVPEGDAQPAPVDTAPANPGQIAAPALALGPSSERAPEAGVEILDPVRPAPPRPAPGPVRLVRARVVKRRRAEAMAEIEARERAGDQAAAMTPALEAAPVVNLDLARPLPEATPVASAQTVAPARQDDLALEDILAASEAALADFADDVDPADVVISALPSPVEGEGMSGSDRAATESDLTPLSTSQPAPRADEKVRPTAQAAKLAAGEEEDELSRILAAIRADDVLYDPPQPLAVPASADSASPDAAAPVDARSSELAPTAARSQSLAPLQLRSAMRVSGPGAEESAMDQRRERLKDSDASVTRILRETNSQLDDSENSRRRSTIAHLKAAVAATRADRAEGGERQEDEGELSRYREDLQRVVRPQRSDLVPPPRRLAPLMLVSELRIDAPPAQVSPQSEPLSVSPLGISSGNLALAEAEQHQPSLRQPVATAAPGSFAEFAQQMGAVELPDLLEAAAAYSVFIEGRPHVSRPQLMDLAMTADSRGASREDGLRAFGTLLRTGRLQKMKRGQFSIAEETRFRPA